MDKYFQGLEAIKLKDLIFLFDKFFFFKIAKQYKGVPFIGQKRESTLG
jgi:hypothetical protein